VLAACSRSGDKYSEVQAVASFNLKYWRLVAAG